MIKRVRTKENQFVRLARQLGQKKARDKNALFILEGIRNLEDATRSDHQVKAVLVNSDFKEKSFQAQLLSRFNKNIPIVELENRLFSDIALTETTQGVILIIQKKEYLLDRILDACPKIIVVADGIQDPGNLGTIIRTSAAAGVDALLVTKGCVDFYNPKAARASMGGIFFLPIAAVECCESLVILLKKRGYRIAVADVEGTKMYYESNLKQPIALVIGSENSGPSKLFKQNADLILKIPMKGEVESLNAVVAAGILIYDTLRQNCATQ